MLTKSDLRQKDYVLLGCCAGSKSRVEQNTVTSKIDTGTQKMLIGETILYVTVHEKGM